MVLSAPAGAVLGDAEAVVVITDDDVPVGGDPVVSIGPVSVAVGEGDSGSAAAEFTVSLSQAAVAPVSVRYATVEGSAVAGLDFTADSGLVSFAVGESSRPVSVAVLGDGLVEGQESFSVVLSAPAGAVLGDAEAVVVITDDDVPVVEPPANPVAAFFGQIGAFVGQIFEAVGQIITQLVEAVTQIFAGIFGGFAPGVPADPAPAAGSPGADGSSISASPLTGVSVVPAAPGTGFPGGASTPQTAA